MLTRLSVSGFKNLVDAQVSFGPFTCIAGANGVGKSNLFDAIRFLSNLADDSLQEAGLTVRDPISRNSSLESLFTKTGEGHADTMHFEAEMIVPPTGIDDLGQPATAQITYLRYRLVLGYEADSVVSTRGRLVIREEELTHINAGDASKALGFAYRAEWRKSVIMGRRTVPFISTEQRDNEGYVLLHQDGISGRPRAYKASTLVRTILSAADAGFAATTLVAKREMQSWQLLQLELSALRQPDSFGVSAHLTANGLHLPATLYRLAQQGTTKAEQEACYARVSSRLAELNDDVRRIRVERDEKRELLSLEMEDRSGIRHSAWALSDGTLRFLALTVIGEDKDAGRVLCVEEPENGIHPALIEAVLQLLQDIATDTHLTADDDNPLRQVIITTHSPVVVQLIPEDCLVVAERVQAIQAGRRSLSQVRFSALPGTWRTTGSRPMSELQPGKLLHYLNAAPAQHETPDSVGAAFKRIAAQLEPEQLPLFGNGHAD